LVSTDPAASSTARLTKFSDAINSRPLFWRSTSFLTAPATSGSVSASVRHIGSLVVSVAIVFLLVEPGRAPAL
jgi:hypothetical protein